MSEVQWPEVVPILDASDMCRGEFDGPGGTSCLLGWCRRTFRDAFDYGFNSDHEAFAALKAEVIKRAKNESERSYICIFNDTRSKRTLAATWNAAMKRLGYTVPCER